MILSKRAVIYLFITLTNQRVKKGFAFFDTENFVLGENL